MKDECAEHKQEGWVTRRTMKGLEHVKHRQGGWEDGRQGWATRDLECIKHERGGMGNEDGWLRGGSSYVHDYLHNHNICYVKIYISSDFVKISLSPHSCFNACEALL